MGLGIQVVGVKEHDVCNLLFNSSGEKKFVFRER